MPVPVVSGQRSNILPHRYECTNLRLFREVENVHGIQNVDLTIIADSPKVEHLIDTEVLNCKQLTS